MDKPSENEQASPPEAGETAWRVRSVRGHIIECRIHPDAEGGFTIRVSGRDSTHLHNACRVRSIGKARRKADEWRQTLLGLDEFQAVP